MAIVVAKIELKSVMDASGMAACIKAGTFGADEVVAVIGKTEGNGGVNDFTRILADQAFRGDDSNVHHHRHAKAAVGGVAAAAIGDPAVFVSVDAMHQGPHGGGPVIAIVDVGE